MNKLLRLFALISPGLFLIGYNIGTGSVTTMATAGAEYGMTLTWPLLLSCLFTFFLLVAFGRYTAVTGETALFAFKRHFGRPLTIFILLSLILSEWVSSMGVMSVVAQSVQEWSRPLTASGAGWDPRWLAPAFAAALVALYWRGRYSFFENLLAVFVGLMGVCFVLMLFLLPPDPAEILRGLAPSIPSGGNPALLIAGMVGTTMGSVLFVVRSILVSEKGWKKDDLTTEFRDSLVSAGVMFLLSIAIMASAAGTLHAQGLKIENAIDMVRLLEPLAGRFASSVFVLGIAAAGLSSLFAIYLLAPWLLQDYLGLKRDMCAPWVRALVLFSALLSCFIPFFGGRPVFMMILSQAIITIATPIPILLMWLLLNRPALLGSHTLSPAHNAAFALVTVFTFLMSLTGLFGLFQLL